MLLTGCANVLTGSSMNDYAFVRLRTNSSEKVRCKAKTYTARLGEREIFLVVINRKYSVLDNITRG